MRGGTETRKGSIMTNDIQTENRTAAETAAETYGTAAAKFREAAAAAADAAADAYRAIAEAYRVEDVRYPADRTSESSSLSAYGK